jgi:hypothetical protein
LRPDKLVFASSRNHLISASFLEILTALGLPIRG